VERNAALPALPLASTQNLTMTILLYYVLAVPGGEDNAAISYQLSAISFQLSAFSFQLSAFGFRLSAASGFAVSQRRPVWKPRSG